jgi:hypothetical protein
MHTVVLTPTFLQDCSRAGVSESELAAMVARVAAEPLAGDVIPGTGGARKLRFGAPRRGKSGGYRAITFFAADDVPVFMLALVDKAQRADISQADRNELRRILGGLAESYRKGVRDKLRRTRETAR